MNEPDGFSRAVLDRTEWAIFQFHKQRGRKVWGRIAVWTGEGEEAVSSECFLCGGDATQVSFHCLMLPPVFAFT